MSDLWPSPPPPPTSSQPPSPPPASPPPPIGRGRVIAGALVGLLIVLVVATTAGLALTDDDEPSGRATPTTESEGSPGGESPGTGAPGGSTTVPSTDIDTAIDEGMAFVEQARQRQFTTRPVVNVLDDAAFVERYTGLLDDAIAKDPEGFEAAEVVYKALGLIDADADLREVEASFGAAGVIAFYDTEINELVLREGDVTPFARAVIVHELVHALDDQLVELYRPEFDDAKDEVGFGLSAVAEGNARRIENAFRATLSADERRDAAREEMSYGAGLSLDDFTLAYLLLQIAPYEYGAAFVEKLAADGGEDAVDAALREPPRTSEQVIDFSKYQALEPRTEVPPPAADGPVIDEGVFGQAALIAILTGSVGTNAASQAAEGWGGDWYVAWRDETSSCLRASFVMETERDLRELSDALSDWADEQGDHIDVQRAGEQVSFTSCVD